MPKMQKMQAVIQGPDLGRGQMVSYLIIGQDLHQIQEKYGADAAATIMSTTAAKIVMRQNDWSSAEKFSQLMGNKITTKEKVDKDTGNVSMEKGTPELLYSPMDILKMDSEKQIVLLQGWYHRPLELDQHRYYKDDKLKTKSQIPKASPLPEYLIPSHHTAMGYAGTPKIYDNKTKTTREIKS